MDNFIFCLYLYWVFIGLLEKSVIITVLLVSLQ